MIKVILTGGGTGGHIYPALAVAEAIRLREPRAEIRYIGTQGGPEAEIVPACGLSFYGVTAKKLQRLASPATVGVLLAFLRGYREAAALLRSFHPDVVISTGGYTTAATTLAAAWQGRPTIIQEYNAIPGRTNRWLSRWATRICVWFGETAAAFPADKVVTTGVPIRADAVGKMQPKEARREMGLAEEAFTLLVIGGSQGAQRINEVITHAVELARSGVQIIHQTGPKNYDAVLAMARAHPFPQERYRPVAYLDGPQLTRAYRAADLVLCRCGVSTLAEVTANGLPSILVPLPTAYADHQTANARAIEREGAGVLLPQRELTPDSLCKCVSELRNEPARLARMAEASRSLGRPDAADRVAAVAFELTE
jgi:UDP-N-acetylglucosamine--N-acetylmuramyl-(pentapeptide) pyrophosphoryl-undecaprenol N-acetylglucosamine transferase